MPRRNRRRHDARPMGVERALGGFTRTEQHPDGEWNVRNVGPSDRTYLCPGCQQWFSAVAHVVAWPADDFVSFGGVEVRRHWHSSCWRARNHRRPGGAWR